jgi:glycosyltransferase involved in cell wall biosynthesis
MSMRIAYVTDTREIGGAERYLATLAEQAATRGHEIAVLAPQAELVAWLAREAPNAGAVRAFDDDYQDASNPVHRGAALLALLPRIARSLRKLAPHVVHVNNGGFPGSDLCRLTLSAARAAGVARRVMTVHSNPLPRDHMTDPRIQAVADRIVWSSAQVVVSPSEAVAEGLAIRRGMPRRLGRTIYYGVAPARHEPQAVARLRERLAPHGQMLVGMVCARPVAEKGHRVFLDALAATGDDVRGAIVGAPPDDLAGRAVAAGLRQRLAIEGPRENVGDYYAACDVLVVPSTAGECMPLVILEAASVGTPTLGSALAGIPEAIADGVEGRLFEPGVAAELAELIRWAARDRTRTAAMGRAAHRRWLASFQIDTMIDATLALYRR